MICAGVFLLDYLIMDMVRRLHYCIYAVFVTYCDIFSRLCSYNLLKKISMFSIEVLFIINFDSSPNTMSFSDLEHTHKLCLKGPSELHG